MVSSDIQHRLVFLVSGKVDAGKDKPSSASSSDSSSGAGKKSSSDGPSDVVELTDANFNKLVMKDDKNVW